MEIITVQINSDGYLVNGNMYVPNDPGNRHYIMVQEWIAAGNTPEEEDIPLPPTPLTDIQKLEQATGLTVAEIKVVLDI